MCRMKGKGFKVKGGDLGEMVGGPGAGCPGELGAPNLAVRKGGRGHAHGRSWDQLGTTVPANTNPSVIFGALKCSWSSASQVGDLGLRLLLSL